MGANSNSVLSLIPVQRLLSLGERHLISNYQYHPSYDWRENLLCFFRRVGTAEYQHILSERKTLAHLLVSQKFPMALMYGNPTMPSCAFTRLRVSQPKLGNGVRGLLPSLILLMQLSLKTIFETQIHEL